MNFDIIPAIDLRGGRVVRLRQGDYALQTTYDTPPAELAARYAASGATWLHLVDLDGARAGGFRAYGVVRAAAAEGLQVQAGGGVRGEADVAKLLDAGASRVVIGSLALREPETVAEWLVEYGGDRIVIALDARWRDGAWRLPSAGWTVDETVGLRELATRFAAAGARHVLATDIDCDGMLAGPNLALYRDLADWQPGLAVQASGGVRNVADIAAVRAAGVAGVILGRALLEGQFELAEALTC